MYFETKGLKFFVSGKFVVAFATSIAILVEALG